MPHHNLLQNLQIWHTNHRNIWCNNHNNIAIDHIVKKLAGNQKLYNKKKVLTLSKFLDEFKTMFNQLIQQNNMILKKVFKKICHQQAHPLNGPITAYSIMECKYYLMKLPEVESLLKINNIKKLFVTETLLTSKITLKFHTMTCIILNILMVKPMEVQQLSYRTHLYNMNFLSMQRTFFKQQAYKCTRFPPQLLSLLYIVLQGIALKRYHQAIFWNGLAVVETSTPLSVVMVTTLFVVETSTVNTSTGAVDWQQQKAESCTTSWKNPTINWGTHIMALRPRQNSRPTWFLHHQRDSKQLFNMDSYLYLTYIHIPIVATIRPTFIKTSPRPLLYKKNTCWNSFRELFCQNLHGNISLKTLDEIDEATEQFISIV